MPDSRGLMVLPPAWRRSLQHRPLLAFAMAVGAGAAAGPYYAAALQTSAPLLTRQQPVLWLPFLMGLALLMPAAALRGRRPWLSAATLLAALSLAVTTHSARRMVPPAGDISQLVHSAEVPNGPLARVPITLYGWVDGYPRREQFGIEFPLTCEGIVQGGARRRQAGRVWVRAPLGTTFEIGDGVSFEAELADLPRPGNPGEIIRQDSFIEEACWCIARIKQPHDLQVLRAGGRYPMERWVSQVRVRLLRSYEDSFAAAGVARNPYPHATAQLLSAMVFGQGGLGQPLPQLLREEFRMAGLAHVLVASGTQVTFLVLILLGAARLVGLRRWWLLALVVPLLLLYGLVAGGAASIWRATIGGIGIAVAMLLGRDVDGLSLWCLALSLLLLADPAQIYSLSLQLTFAGTWGMLALSREIHGSMQRYLGSIKGLDLAALSVAAQAATMPLTLIHFGRASLAGIAASWVAFPLAGVMVGTGLLGLVMPFCNALNYPLTRLMHGIAINAAAAPGATVEVPRVGVGWVISYYGLLMAIAFGLSLTRRFDSEVLRGEWQRWWQSRLDALRAINLWQTAIAALLLLTALVVWHTIAGRNQLLSVTLIDVGQGESILIKAPSGRAMLIDGGSSSTERGDVGRAVIVPYLESAGVRKLDALVMTHSDSDHCNALTGVLREVPVDMMLDGSLPDNFSAGRRGGNSSGAEPPAPPGVATEQELATVEYHRLREALQERHIPRIPAHAGQRLHLGDGVELQVLSPLQPLLQDDKADNNNGIVMRLDYGATSFLFTADIEQSAEERLVHRGANLRCTVLKLAHHGSKSSTCPALLNAARPSLAMLSCGRYNPFGHPSASVLARLAARHIPVFRTDAQGAVNVVSDGRACWVQTYR